MTIKQISNEEFIDKWNSTKDKEEVAKHFKMKKNHLYSKIIEKRPGLKEKLDIKKFHHSKVKKSDLKDSVILKEIEKCRFKKELIAKNLKISISTLIRVLNERPDLNEKFDDLKAAFKASIVNEAEIQLAKQVSKGNINAIKLTLTAYAQDQGFGTIIQKIETREVTNPYAEKALSELTKLKLIDK